MDISRKSRPAVALGIKGESVVAGDHLALFYDTDEEFANALAFIETGLKGTDHCILFGIPSDTDRMRRVLRERGWDVERLVREGWPSEEEFYKLEATVSAATLNLPCVAICMFDLRTQSAHTIMRAAFEGHPVTIHRNCIRENPLYVPRATRS